MKHKLRHKHGQIHYDIGNVRNIEPQDTTCIFMSKMCLSSVETYFFYRTPFKGICDVSKKY
jgi:hypothetical protein